MEEEEEEEFCQRFALKVCGLGVYWKVLSGNFGNFKVKIIEIF